MPFAAAALQCYVASGIVKPENTAETNVVEEGDVEKQCEGAVIGVVSRHIFWLRALRAH